jgi:hypothetical protein
MSRSSNEDLGSKEKDLEFEVKDVSSSEDPFDTTDDDLDPVALNKAFRFASISSLVLVSNLCYLPNLTDVSSSLVRRDDSCHSASIILRANDLYCAWSSDLGVDRHRMGVLLPFCSRNLSII